MTSRSCSLKTYSPPITKWQNAMPTAPYMSSGRRPVSENKVSKFVHLVSPTMLTVDEYERNQSEHNEECVLYTRGDEVDALG